MVTRVAVIYNLRVCMMQSRTNKKSKTIVLEKTGLEALPNAEGYRRIDALVKRSFEVRERILGGGKVPERGSKKKGARKEAKKAEKAGKRNKGGDAGGDGTCLYDTKVLYSLLTIQ